MLEKIIVFCFGAFIAIQAAYAENAVIGQLNSKGKTSAYIQGEKISTKNESAKLVLSSGDAVVDISKNSTATVSSSPLSLTMYAGDSCITLGAGKGLDLVDATGKTTTFSAKNNAAIAISAENGVVKFSEIASCLPGNFVAAVGEGATILGVSTTTAAIVGGAIIAGAVVVDNNNDDNQGNASPVR